MRRICATALALAALTACAGDPSSTVAEPSQTASAASVSSESPAAPESGETLACGIAVPQDLTLEQQIAQTLFVFQPASGELDPEWAAGLGGIFLEHTEVPPYLLSMKQESVFAPFVAADDEGGRVQWRDDPARPLPAALDLGELPLEEMTGIVRVRGESLRTAGVDVTFAPVVDLYPGTRDGVIGDRAFSSDPDEVVLLAGAYAEAFEEAGLITTLKHFPGHGLATGDSHLGLPTTAALSELEARDLIPFRELIASGPTSRWVMMGHLDVPGLTSGEPASLSRDAYDYLRKELGHEGLIVTDELSGMQAITAEYGPSQAVIKALKAGADLALIASPGDLSVLIDDVKAAVDAGQLPRSRVAKASDRVLVAKACARA